MLLAYLLPRQHADRAVPLRMYVGASFMTVVEEVPEQLP